jgi:hypothetical protein
VGQNPSENGHHERISPIANESLDIIVKAGTHEGGTEDLVLAEDEKEEPDGDA